MENVSRNEYSSSILLQKVNLIFDPNIPEFKLTASEQPIEFYDALFRDVQEVSSTSMLQCMEDLEQDQCRPTDHIRTNEYLKRVMSRLSAKGSFVSFDKEKQSSPEDKTPIITRSPVLFVRKRSLGFANAIERILKDLPEVFVLPEAITRITGIDLGSEDRTKISFDSLDVNGEHEDILFTKYANKEQLDIALKINKFGSV